MVINIKKLTDDAIIPSRGSEHAAGYDLYSLESYELKVGERHAFKTGISMEIPNNLYGRIAPRSGLAVKKGIDTLAGTIDSDYRGEILAVLINFGQESVMINKGDRIAQMIFEYFASPTIMAVSNLTVTQRNMGGFGSTGGYSSIDKINRQNNDLGVSLEDINEVINTDKELKLNE